MAITTVKFAFHLFAFCVDAFTVYYDYFEIDIGHAGFGGKYKFLTMWSIILQTIYFGLNIIVDLTEKVSNPTNATQRNGLQKLRDFFHNSIAFPLAVFVAFTFWALYAVDRELVYPKALDAIIPVWLNHLLHTTIVPLVVVDKMLTRHFYTGRLYGILGTCGLSLTYLFWILLIAYIDDFWVYPILKVLKAYERALFIGVCLVIFGLFYLLGEYLTKSLWGSQRKPVRGKRNKRKS